MRGRAEFLLVAVLGLAACGDGGTKAAPPTALTTGASLLAPDAAPVLPDVPPEGQSEDERAAFARLSEAARAPGAGPAEFGALGMQFHVAARPSAAVTCYRAATVAEPNEPRWRYLLARLDAAAGRIDEAIVGYERAAARTRRARSAVAEHGAVLFWWGRALLDAGRHADARARLLEARAVLGDKPAILLALARTHIDAPDRAAQILDLALLSAPDAPDVLAVAAATHAALGDTTRSAELAERARRAEGGRVHIRDPWFEALGSLSVDRDTLRQRAASALRAGDAAAARHWLERAVLLDADDVESLCDLAIVSAATGDLAAGERHARVAVRRSPESAASHAALGRVLLHVGRVTEARAALLAALSHDPGHVEANVALARVEGAGGDFATARGRLAAAIASAPDHAVARRLYARACALGGDAAEAIDALRALREDAPSDRALGVDLARVLAVSGDASAALALAKRLSRTAPSAETRLALAHALAASGDSQGALDALRAEVVRASESSESLRAMLEVWNQEGPGAALWSPAEAFAVGPEPR